MKTLKNVMFINAISSGMTGLLLAVFADSASQLMGVANPLFTELTGLFLVAFAVLVFVQARKTPVNRPWLRLIIALDIIWVVDSVAVIGFQLFGLSMTGYVLVGLVAAWVAVMARLQLRGFRQLSAG